VKACMKTAGLGAGPEKLANVWTRNGKNYMLKCDYQSPDAPALKNTACKRYSTS
jgi:hypothetical protein